MEAVDRLALGRAFSYQLRHVLRDAYLMLQQLTRLFHRELSISPWDYLNRYRILKARKLLETTSASIGVIARQVGFKDQSYFSRVFHKIVGVSPQDYLKKLQK